MKSLIPVLAAILFLQSSSKGAEIVTLHVKSGEERPSYSEKEIILEEGDNAQILSAFAEGRQFSYCIALEIAGKEVILPDHALISGAAISKQEWIIAGPAKIRAYTSSSVPDTLSFFTASIERANTPKNTPSNSVVIPEDPAGSYEIILESSVDLITWTLANPGTYGGDTPRRFFRLRSVKK